MPGVCSRCLREVYFAEEKLALGKVWHTFCFSCRNCRKLLDSWTVETHSGELFCRNCHNRLFSTTAVKPSLPIPSSRFLPSVDKKNSPISLCESLSDCRCCCCDEKCIVNDTSNENPELAVEISNCLLEKNRLRGGGGCKEDLETRCSDLEGDNGIDSCDRDIDQLDLRSSPTTICERAYGPKAVTAWYNRHHSASQSTFSRPSSANQNPLRPSSTPVSGEAADTCHTCNLHCSTSRRLGSPCRANHKHCEHSKQCHRHHYHESRRSDRVACLQERTNSIENCRGRNFVQNYRNHLSTDTGEAFFLLVHPFTGKIHDFVTFEENPVTIDSSNFLQLTLPPHLTPPPSRKRVSFLFPKKLRPGSPATRYSAMQNIVDKSHINVISFEPSGEHFDAIVTNSQVETNEDCDNADGYDGNIRMRGGCGGGSSSGGGGCGSGGGGCGCSGGGSRANFDHSGQSSSGTRYQTANEGGCGCSSGGKSGFGSNANSRSFGGYGSEEHSNFFPSSGGHSETDTDGMTQGACGSKFPGRSRLTGYETCPPRSPDRCSPDPASFSPCSAVACSPPCAGRKECCPSAGHRSGPVKKIPRCNAPCTSSSKNCGGGGCCGSGCRGGCGKPGQTCLPLRPCTIPPCMPQSRSGRSPCMPPRSSPPQPSCCRMPVLIGTPRSLSEGGCSGGGLSSCRAKSPGGRTGGGGGCSPSNDYQQQQDDEVPFDSYCQQKIPAGCECLGGGQDCQRCGRKVYQAEMMIASGVPYHNICFSCFCCRKPLETLTYHENCGEIYCKQCYVRNFGPQGYGYSGVLQTPM